MVEETPEHVDVYKLCADIEDVEGVTVVHDVHVWTISSNYYALTAHVLIDPSYDGDLGECLPGCARLHTTTTTLCTLRSSLRRA